MYKEIHNGIANYIKKEAIEASHTKGRIVIREEHNKDVAVILPEEEIPEDFFCENTIPSSARDISGPIQAP